MTNVQNPGEFEHWSMAVVYDPESGDIVHKHESMSLRGGDHPGKEELEKDALDQASRAGRNTARVSVLHVDPQSLKADAHYKVDTKNKKLVEIPQPKGKK